MRGAIASTQVRAWALRGRRRAPVLGGATIAGPRHPCQECLTPNQGRGGKALQLYLSSYSVPSGVPTLWRRLPGDARAGSQRRLRRSWRSVAGVRGKTLRAENCGYVPDAPKEESRSPDWHAPWARGGTARAGERASRTPVPVQYPSTRRPRFLGRKRVVPGFPCIVPQFNNHPPPHHFPGSPPRPFPDRHRCSPRMTFASIKSNPASWRSVAGVEGKSCGALNRASFRMRLGQAIRSPSAEATRPGQTIRGASTGIVSPQVGTDFSRSAASLFLANHFHQAAH